MPAPEIVYLHSRKIPLVPCYAASGFFQTLTFHVLLTYVAVSLLQPRKMHMWHNLELISTSLCCERLIYQHSRNDDDVMMEADGMAGPSLTEALDMYNSMTQQHDNNTDSSSSGDASSSSPFGSIPAIVPTATVAANNVVPLPKGLSILGGGGSGGSSASGDDGGVTAAAVPAAAAASTANPAVTVNSFDAAEGHAVAAIIAASSSSSSQTTLVASLASSPPSSPSKRSGWNTADIVAAKLSEAAAAASAAALQPLASAAGSLYAGSLSLVSSVTSTVTSSVALPVAFPPAADRVVRETIAGITSAEIAGSHPNSKDVKAASASTGTECPSEWFVCDDHSSNTRYFVIQGSDSLDHWKVNLMFEPVQFEDPALGIRVHRGAYKAACALYDRFLPLVQEQLDIDPTARICFTGHSIGGSLAVLLMLMFRHRGVLLPQQIAPVYTFGSPAIFCDGALGVCSTCGLQEAAAGSGEACGLGESLLSRLGLHEDIICAVMTVRDIVPRAFSCDYSLMAELMRSWSPSWRDHSCLSGGVTGAGRRQLYVHIGRMMVLQPSQELKFITEPSPYLPLLPQHGEVFKLLDKPMLSNFVTAPRLRAKSFRNGVPLGRPASSKEEVLAAIMDCPHPLETLSDPGAYGPNGSISRYHNPDNYCKALGRVLADRRAAAADEPAEVPFAVPGNAEKHRAFFPPTGAEWMAGDEESVGVINNQYLLSADGQVAA
eukprot:GHRR01005415.1.p1 GENE.GHRR01005415.1~~GHRR01005415.1.p1  ORF type:complete len:719 (+),score=230.97 GHRR01005415.1:657-2813(+)